MNFYSNFIKIKLSRLMLTGLPFANSCQLQNNCCSCLRPLPCYPDWKSAKFSLLQTTSRTFARSVYYYSTLRHSVIADLSQDIDIEGIKEQCQKAALKTGKQMCAKTVVLKELDKRFVQTIESFNEKQKKALKVIRLEHSFLFSEGYDIPAPEVITNQNWLEALTLSTMEERLDYYLLLKDNREWQMTADSPEEVTSDVDGDDPHSIFYDARNPELLKRWGNYRLASAMQFGIPLVIDMGYVESNMSVELDDIARQLWNLYSVNHLHPQPFHLIFTNCSQLNPIYRHLLMRYMIESSFILATFTEENHVNLFPLHEMVYLSASSKNVCPMFDNNTVYILGAYHDPMVRKKISFARARQQKIRCSRLPIDEHVRWRHQAGKDLNMDQVLGILLCVKESKSWKEAFSSIVPMLLHENS